MRCRVWATNSSIEDRRIGSGSTTIVAPASQVAWMAVTSCRVVGAEQRDVVARADAAGLQRGGVALGLLVEVAPGDDVLAATHDERDGGGRRGGALEALEE